MGIFSKKYDDTNINIEIGNLRKHIESIGTKVILLEARIDSLSGSLASFRNRLNRNVRESESFEEESEEIQAIDKTENINNPVLLPEDGIIRKSRKHR